MILEAKPTCVKETNKSAKPSIISNAIGIFLYYFAPLTCSNATSEEDTQTKEIDSAFDELILSTDIKDRIVDLAHKSCYAQKNKAPFRHALFHGPSGCGKKMAAKMLAKAVGLDFACVCGRDIITTTGEEAVSQIQTLFSWAKMSQNGMLLYIEKAEAFLGVSADSTSLMSEMKLRERNALSTFLFNVKCIRKGMGARIFLVLSTNR